MQTDLRRSDALGTGKTYAEESRHSTHVRAHRLRVLDVDKKKAKKSRKHVTVTGAILDN